MGTNFELTWQRGKDFYKKGNYENAIKYLEKSLRDSNHRIDAYNLLFKIYFKIGLFDQARILLNEALNYNEPSIFYNMGLLEEYEGNFNEAYKYFIECLSYKEFHNLALFNIGKIYAELGINNEAFSIYNKLLNTELYIETKLEIIYTLVRCLEYEKAFQLTDSIKYSELHSKLRDDYNDLITLLKFRMNMIENPSSLRPHKDYKSYLLLYSDDNILLEHIKKHSRQDDKYTMGCFFDNLDLSQLLRLTKEKINYLNPIFTNKVDAYRFSFDKSIGFKKDSKTRDIVVITLLGTKQIITMYPVKFSKEFDKEKFNNNEELSLKRKKL